MNKSISVEVGIYDTAYRLIQHRDGTLTVREPYIKWSNNTGSLAFTKYKIDDKPAVEAVLAFFEADRLELEANTKCGSLTLDDVLEDGLRPGVRVTAK